MHRTQGPGLDRIASKKGPAAREPLPRARQAAQPPAGVKSTHRYTAPRSRNSEPGSPQTKSPHPAPLIRKPLPPEPRPLSTQRPAVHGTPPCTTYPAPCTPAPTGEPTARKRAHNSHTYPGQQATPLRLAAQIKPSKQRAGLRKRRHKTTGDASPGCPPHSPTKSSCNKPAARTPDEPPRTPSGGTKKRHHTLRPITTAQGMHAQTTKPTATRPRDCQNSRGT